MAITKRSAFQIERDRREVTAWYLQGDTQMEIADRLGLSRQQIGYDLKIIQAQWRDATAFDLDEAKAKELARLDHLEREAWQGWARSQLDKQVSTTKELASGTRNSIQQTGQVGDTRFLDVILGVMKQRCKLLGLESPDLTLIQNNYRGIDWAGAIQKLEADKAENAIRESQAVSA